MLQEKAEPAASPARRADGAQASTVCRTLQIGGELLLAAGVIALLLVAWQLSWTNLEADARKREVVKGFARGASGPARGAASRPDPNSGPTMVRLATALVLLVGALVLMVQFLFPWMAQFSPFTDSTIGRATHP